MLTVLVVTVLVLVVLVAVDLALTCAVVRRLKTLEPASLTVDELAPGVAVGDPVPELPPLAERVVWPDDGPLTREDAQAIAFVSSTCAHCRRELPAFLDSGIGAERMLVVIKGDEEASADLRALAEGRARVIGEGHLGAVSDAFEIAGFPTFIALAGGSIAAIVHEGASLRAAPAATAHA